MNDEPETQDVSVDIPTVAAIAAVSTSLTVGLHELVHAFTCIAVGGTLRGFSALYADTSAPHVWQQKVIAGSAPLFNVVLGLFLLVIVHRSQGMAPRTRWFLWLWMLMNLLSGTGYLMFSGIANVGDVAVVISGGEPQWFFRALITVVGSAMFMSAVWVALREWGRMVGGGGPAQISRSSKLCVTSYFSALAAVALAGVMSPTGITSLPVVAGVFAVAGGQSPLLWMMQWFRAHMFLKAPGPPLEVQRDWGWMLSGVVVTLLYAVVLGASVTL